MMAEKKGNLIDTMREQIDEVFKTPEEVRRIEVLLEETEQQTAARKIVPVREYSWLKKNLTLWKIRFHYGIHWNKPFYPFRLAKNVILGKWNYYSGKKEPILRGIEFAGTYRCNFECNHCLCSRLEESQTRKEMEPADYARIVDEAVALGATTFGLEGGEPFVSPVWEEILQACSPKKNHVIISTNGYLFDEEKAKKCAEMGIDTINFSLDSGIAELHDLFRRRRGSFERVMRGIELCRKYGIKVIINTVVYKGNVYTRHFRELLDFAEREKLLINTLFAKGVGNFKNKDVMLDADDLKAYEELVKPYNYVQRHLAYNYGKQFGCPGTKEMINMTPYGDVLNCANMHIYSGNVMDEPLKVVRERALKELPFGEYRPCFLADDPDFMEVYYGLLEKKSYITMEEFRDALREYEKEHGKKVYPELN
jgi:MoaA/NifB/PqqE/SkfB family radical SAM enzyme